MSVAEQGRPSPRLLWLAVFGLFAIWSNSFIANEYLLSAPDRRFDWLGLTVARYLLAAAVCWIYCLGWRRRETAAILRRHPWRLLACATLAVPGYNFCLAYGQQQGMPAPVASVTTTLAPLFMMVLAALCLGERPPPALWLGLAVSGAGMAVIGSAGRDASGVPYSLAVAIAACAPLCWSVYSVLSKPIASRVSPLVWTYLSVGLGGLMVAPLAWGRAGTQWAALDGAGWAALLYLAWPCTVVGYAVWTGLLRHLPATVVGLTVFLNPPLATLSKAVLAHAFPATFAFIVGGRDWLGGAIVLAGLALTRRAGAR
jgi:O-acetylserine/cysteine efflux transporter